MPRPSCQRILISLPFLAAEDVEIAAVRITLERFLNLQAKVGGDDPGRFGVRVWIATGHTDMRRGMNTLALTVQEALKRDPARRRSLRPSAARTQLIKILWHDGLGMSLYAKAAGAWPLRLANRRRMVR